MIVCTQQLLMILMKVFTVKCTITISDVPNVFVQNF